MKSIFNAVGLLGTAVLVACNISIAQQSESTNPVSPEPADADVPNLVRQLGHRDYGMRKTAEQSLRKLQPSAVEIIQRHLRSSDDPEVKIRLRRIIAHITHHRLDMKTLESIVIPEIDFRQANIHDCLLFLETASAEVGSSTNKSSRKRVKFITKFSAAAEEGVPFITFKARYINLHEALKIITEISNLQFHIEGGAVIVEEWKHSR